MKFDNLEPELNLIVGCLQRAFKDLKEPSKLNNSREWFFKNSIEPFSFLWCLQCLNMEHLTLHIRKMIIDNKDFCELPQTRVRKKGTPKEKKIMWYTPTDTTPHKECCMCHKVKLETDFYMRNHLMRWDMCKDCYPEFLRARKRLAPKH